MDGNPNVGADTIAATLAAQRALVLARTGATWPRSANC